MTGDTEQVGRYKAFSTLTVLCKFGWPTEQVWISATGVTTTELPSIYLQDLGVPQRNPRNLGKCSSVSAVRQEGRWRHTREEKCSLACGRGEGPIIIL